MGYQESVIRVENEAEALELARGLNRDFIDPYEIVKSKTGIKDFAADDMFLWVGGRRHEQHTERYIFIDDIFGWDNDDPMTTLFDILPTLPELRIIKRDIPKEENVLTE
jgi:hypothetical protein